jgi:hypothetical protein
MIEPLQRPGRIIGRGFMKARSRSGHIIAGLLVFFVLAIVGVVITAVYIANTVRVEHRATSSGDRVVVDTGFGKFTVDARDDLKPESVGVPVYPGAVRESHSGKGGVTFDFEGIDRGAKQLSVVAAEYSTDDSVDQVRAFYQEKLPHWIFVQKHGRGLEIKFSEGGYKRIIAIDERNGRTHIGIASIGEGGIN